MKSDIAVILNEINKFRNERDWAQFHDAKNLAINLSVESAELLEVFLWKNPEDADVNKIKNELADVLYSAFLIADKFKIDIKEAILDKLKENSLKYPVPMAKGSNKKYDDL